MTKGGRKTKFTPQLQKNLCKFIREGHTYADAAAMVGISYETLRSWREEKPAFSVAIEGAEAECKAEFTKRIMEASKKDWRAAAWWLERRFPHDYGKDATGDGKPEYKIYFGFSPSKHIKPDDAQEPLYWKPEQPKKRLKSAVVTAAKARQY